MNSKSRYIIYTAIILAIIVFSLIPFSGGDNAKYYLLSRSLRQGHYKELWNPDNSIHTQIPATFPALLVPAQNYTSAKIIISIFFVLSLFAYMYYIKDFKKPIGFIALILFVFSPILREYSHYVLSEIPYIFFSLMALIFAQKKKYIWALVFALITFYTRVIGMTLLITIVILSVFNREKFRYIGLIFFIPASIYFIRIILYKGGRSNYFPYINPMMFFHNFKMFATDVLGRLFGTPQISIMLLCIMLYGIWKYRNRLIEIYAGLYILVLMMWSAGWDHRLYLPLLPIFAIWIAHGIYHITQHITKDNIILGWIAGLFVLGNLSHAVAIAPKTWKDNMRWIEQRELPNERKYVLMKHYLEIDKMIEKENIPKKQVFVAQKCALFYLITDRQAVKQRR